MEITFEILREAGVRMPRAVGSAISIVGALVIGQSAVEAGIVTATMVIVVSLTAISSFETIRSKTKVKRKIDKGKPKIDITITSEGNVGNVESKIDLSKPENIKELEEKYNKDISDQVETVIKKVQEEYQSDIFGFGEVIHRADPKAWKRLEKNWDQEFTTLDVTVKVDAKIRRLGTIIESFQKETEE